jgi:two-component system chemotaxis response regulator CheB
VKIFHAPKVNHHRPSVGVLFNSCISTSGSNTVAFLLTGMGNDGAHEMKGIRRCGGKTFAQEKNSCVVFGMPKEACIIDGVLTMY